MLNRVLLFVAATVMFCTSAQAAQDIHKYFSNLTTFEARFTQRLFNADQDMIEESRGRIQVKRPDKFRLEYTKPYKQVYVADGKQLWSYDADLEQVIVKSQKGLLHNTPAMILSNPNMLDKEYRIKHQKSDDGLVWFQLTPKAPGSNFDEIQLAFDQHQFRIMEMKDGFGQITRLQFQNIRRNPSFNAKTFRFTPPKGVDVIKQ
jgi:outer membrane lipoprotein carrier protein